jgi:hypothetical protein
MFALLPGNERLGWSRPLSGVARALKLAAEASKICDRKIEVRPFLRSTSRRRSPSTSRTAGPGTPP